MSRINLSSLAAKILDFLGLRSPFKELVLEGAKAAAISLVNHEIDKLPNDLPILSLEGKVLAAVDYAIDKGLAHSALRGPIMDGVNTAIRYAVLNLPMSLGGDAYKLAAKKAIADAVGKFHV